MLQTLDGFTAQMHKSLSWYSFESSYFHTSRSETHTVNALCANVVALVILAKGFLFVFAQLFIVIMAITQPETVLMSLRQLHVLIKLFFSLILLFSSRLLIVCFLMSFSILIEKKCDIMNCVKTFNWHVSCMNYELSMAFSCFC